MNKIERLTQMFLFSLDPSKLAAIQSEERKLALAIHDCDSEFADETRQATLALASAWADRHRTALSAIRTRLLAVDADIERLAAKFSLDAAPSGRVPDLLEKL